MFAAKLQKLLPMTDPVSIAAIVLAFLLGGGVKGLAGMGLPAVTVAVLTFAFGLPAAMALMIVPGLLTNFWQATSGGHAWPALRRILPFLLASLCTIWFGTGLLVTMDSSWLVFVLGMILTVYALVNLLGFVVNISRAHERWIGPLFGAVNGVTTGMTGVTSTPSVIYLNGLGMKRDMMVQAMGLLFFISYIVLSGALWLRGLLNTEIGLISVAAVIPALVGMEIGRRLRSYTTESSFKRVLNYVLLAMGLYLMVRSTVF